MIRGQPLSIERLRRAAARCGFRRSVLVRRLAGVLAAAWTAAGAGATDSLTLSVPLESDLASALGPATLEGDAAPRFDPAAECLAGTPAAKGPAPTPAVVAAWPAAAILDNAQGAVFLRFRSPQADPRAGRTLPPVLRLAGGGGGEWTLHLRETPYQPKKTVSAQEAREAAQDVLDATAAGLEAGGVEETVVATDLPALEDVTPRGTLQCNVALKLFPEAPLTRAADVTLDVREPAAWHTLLWSWRSGHHFLWLDGRLAGHVSVTHTLSRLAPMRRPEARLELLASPCDIRDLRVFSRFIEEGAAVPPEAAGPPPVRVWADWAFTGGRAVVFIDAKAVPAAARARVECVNTGTGEVAAELEVPGFPSGLAESVFKVFDPKPFAPGTYRMQARVFDAAGNALGEAASAPWVAAKQDWPWLGFDKGEWDSRVIKVLPPFTPLRAEGVSVRTVLWQFTLDPCGLPASLRMGEHELLAASVSLRVTAAGQPLEFTGPAPAITVAPDGDTAAWTAHARSAAGHRLDIEGDMEYDGMCRYDVTLTPAELLDLDGVQLRIPYRPEIVRLAHAGLWLWHLAIERDEAGRWKTDRIQWCGLDPKRARREGVLLDAGDVFTASSQSTFDPVPNRHPFASYLHIGNADCGLAWFAENDRGWIHDPGGRLPMELVALGEDTHLELNVVARRTELREPLRFRFFLMPNPWKPLPDRWRTWVIGSYGADHNAITPRSRHVFWWHWNEYAGGFRPYPGVAAPGETPPAAAADGKHALTGSKRYEDWIGAFADSRNQTPPVYHTPFVNYGTPGGFQAYNEEAMATPYSWKLHNNRAVRSYMTYWLDRCAREIGIAGVYVDEPYVQGWSYNVLAGDAPYVRADGTRAIGYQYLDGRAYFRRFKQMFTENGSDYSVWAHTTSQKVYPQLAFADISMDGEHPSIWVPEFSNYHSFYNPRYSRGCLAGHNTGMVGAQMYHANTDARPGRDPDALVKVHWKNRTFLAVTLPYGVLPMPATCAAEYNRAQNLAARIGVLDAGIEEVSAHELPARVPGVSFTPALQGMHALVNRAAAQALLFASAPRPAAYDHAEAPRLHLAGDWGGLLAATGKAVHLWNAENGVSLATADGLELDLPPLDFAALWIEARPAPQPPRPPGVILGLSFDAGVEPDFGAGLTPPRAAAPDLVEGRKGRALKLRSSQTGVAYPLVPAWNGGALECDLRLDRLTRTPLPLLRLSEHLDLTLTASLRDGRPALVLTTRDAPVTEQPMSGVWVFDGKADAGEPHETVAPLPADATGAWHRLALVWRCGWYQLYWDGQRLAESRVPASPRIQSAAVGAMGVAIGPDEPVGGGDEAEAAVDSVLLYDWPLGEANLAEGDRNPFVPVRRPPPQAHGRVWADAPDRDNVRVAAWFAGASRPWDVERVRFTVRAGGPTGRELGRADVMPWQARGYASRWIRFHLKELPDTGLPDLADTEPEETDADNETWHVRADFLRLVREGKETRDEVLFNAETEVALDVFDLPEAK